jgi:hypothetical protein
MEVQGRSLNLRSLREGHAQALSSLTQIAEFRPVVSKNAIGKVTCG